MPGSFFTIPYKFQHAEININDELGQAPSASKKKELSQVLIQVLQHPKCEIQILNFQNPLDPTCCHLVEWLPAIIQALSFNTSVIILELGKVNAQHSLPIVVALNNLSRINNTLQVAQMVGNFENLSALHTYGIQTALIQNTNTLFADNRETLRPLLYEQAVFKHLNETLSSPVRDLKNLTRIIMGYFGNDFPPEIGATEVGDKTFYPILIKQYPEASLWCTTLPNSARNVAKEIAEAAKQGNYALVISAIKRNPQIVNYKMANVAVEEAEIILGDCLKPYIAEIIMVLDEWHFLAVEAGHLSREEAQKALYDRVCLLVGPLKQLTMDSDSSAQSERDRKQQRAAEVDYSYVTLQERINYLQSCANGKTFNIKKWSDYLSSSKNFLLELLKPYLKRSVSDEIAQVEYDTKSSKASSMASMMPFFGKGGAHEPQIKPVDKQALLNLLNEYLKRDFQSNNSVNAVTLRCRLAKLSSLPAMKTILTQAMQAYFPVIQSKFKDIPGDPDYYLHSRGFLARLKSHYPFAYIISEMSVLIGKKLVESTTQPGRAGPREDDAAPGEKPAVFK